MGLLAYLAFTRRCFRVIAGCSNLGTVLARNITIAKLSFVTAWVACEESPLGTCVCADLSHGDTSPAWCLPVAFGLVKL